MLLPLSWTGFSFGSNVAVGTIADWLFHICILSFFFSGVLNWLDSSAKADHSSPDKVSIDAFMKPPFVLSPTHGLLMDMQFGTYSCCFAQTDVALWRNLNQTCY
jgi:hypothetical protein